MQENKQEFGWFRSIFFPIYSHEIAKFLPMAFMMFFILFNYTLLRNIKDTVIMTGNGADADIIPYVKLWGTTPFAILFMLAYSKLTSIFKREHLFYLCLAPFILFFALYAFVIAPNLSILHPSADTVSHLKSQMPRLKGIFSMWGNWSSVLFYILAEMWGSVILSLLFWQYANEICAKQQATRYYPLFGFIGNIGLIISGFVGQYFAQLGTKNLSGDSWQFTLNYLTGFIVINGLLLCLLYYYLNRKQEKTEEPIRVKTKSKPKLSMKESFQYIFSSKHLMYIAILVFAYGLSINLLDVIWKGQVKLMFNGDKNLIQGYMSSYSKLTGFLSLPLMLIGGHVLRKLSWKKAANITPIIMMVLGVLFFGIVYYGSMYSPTATLMTVSGFSFTAVTLASGLGFWQNALTKATKYSLFDSTKEMAFIPLDQELRTKGKAAVDVVGGRSGKSGGSIAFVLLSTIFPNTGLTKLSPIIFCLFIGVLVLWFFATWGLNRCLKQGKEETDTKSCLQAA